MLFVKSSESSFYDMDIFSCHEKNVRDQQQPAF